MVNYLFTENWGEKKKKRVNFEKIVTCSYPFILTMLSYKNMIYKIELLEIVYLSAPDNQYSYYTF